MSLPHAQEAALPPPTCSADVCRCGHVLESGEQLYSCQVCGLDCHAECSNHWDGDEEDNPAFAGMWLDVVCDHCLDEGFVPPASAQPNAEVRHAATSPSPATSAAPALPPPPCSASEGGPQ